MSKNLKQNQELDSVYLLKLLLFAALGIQWLHIAGASWSIPIPYGSLLGLLLAAHDHFAIDRKIEYAVLVVAMLVGYFLTGSLVLTVH